MAYSHHPSFSPFSNCRPDLFGTAQLQHHNGTDAYPPGTGHTKRHSWQKLAKAFSLSRSKDKINDETRVHIHPDPDNSGHEPELPEQNTAGSWNPTAAPSIQLHSDSVTNLAWQQQNTFADDAHIYGAAPLDHATTDADYSLYPQPDPLVRQLSNKLRNSLQLTTIGTNTSCDYLSPVVSETASINNQAGTSSPITKRSRCKEIDEYPSDDDERYIKRSRQHSPDPAYTPPQDCVLFACPFSKFDPEKYSHKNIKESDREYRNCSTGYWPTIARLKQHIYRTHDRSEKCCQQCWQSFTNEHLLKKHAAAATCEAKPCPPERMTTEQRRSIKERAQCDTTQQWYKIWDVLFPGHLRPHSVTPEWVTGRDVLKVFQTVRERLPDLLSVKSGNGHLKQQIEHAIDLICDDFSGSNNFTDFLSSSYLTETLDKPPTYFTDAGYHMPDMVHSQLVVSVEDHGSYDAQPQQSIPESSYSKSADAETNLDQTPLYSDHGRPVDIIFPSHHASTILPQSQHIVSDTNFLSYPFPDFDMSLPPPQVYADHPQH